jgi:hypothetical protein
MKKNINIYRIYAIKQNLKNFFKKYLILILKQYNIISV